jgi:hypothetical protein
MDEIELLLRQATVDLIADGTYFAEITGIEGAWANGVSREGALQSCAKLLSLG